MKALITPLLAAMLSACSTLDKPFLYKAEKADRSLYVFGTLHSGVPGWDLPGDVTGALKRSDVAYFERDPIQVKGGRGEQVFLESGEKTIDQWLTKEEYRALVESLSEVPRERLAELRPILVLALLRTKLGTVTITDYEERSSRFDTGLDYSLASLAREKGVPVEELDSGVYDTCRVPRDAAAVVRIQQILRGLTVDDLYARSRDLIENYRHGDEAGIVRSSPETGDDCILNERNRRWANLLEKNVRPGSHPFVAVGVAHLFDTQEGPGLLTLLRNQGYLIRRLER